MHLKNFKSLQCPDMFESLDPSSKELENLKDPKFWSSIPLLNYTPLHLLKDLGIVRFRGMIQDMQDPEIYLERYEVKNNNDDTKRTQNGKYRDCLFLKVGEEVNYDAELNVHGERRTLFVVGIPAINNWAMEYEKQSNSVNVPNINAELASTTTENLVKKRSAPSETMEVDVEESNTKDSKFKTSEDTHNETVNKRQCKEELAAKRGAASVFSADYLLNSPIPERPSKACMIKIYGNFDDYALNTVIDVIGFLSVDPALDCSNIDAEMYGIGEDGISELHVQHPPPSLIPRLHAIAVQILPHYNPLLDERFISSVSTVEDAEHFNMLSIQKELRILLSLCFFNDELAADYVMSHLISTVYSRSDFQCIGKFSLNICNLPKELPADYTKKLYEILELLLPASHYLPMTLDTLNTSSFVPKKDYETNKLVSGLLQLAPQTHLILDETHMKQGKLESSGVLAVQNLANLINHQQIKCNFQYYDIDYNVDVPVLVLSEGRSMLPNEFTLPLQNESQTLELMEETLKAARHYLQPERLDRFRRYLTKAKTATYVMNPDDSEIVQQDFVEMRKNGGVNTVDEFHALLVLSRLLGIARGKNVFEKDSWELAKEMELKRRQRLRELPQSKRINRN